MLLPESELKFSSSRLQINEKALWKWAKMLGSSTRIFLSLQVSLKKIDVDAQSHNVDEARGKTQYGK